VSQFRKEKNDELVPRDGGELAWHQVQPAQADLVLLSFIQKANMKWDWCPVQYSLSRPPLWTSLAYDLLFKVSNMLRIQAQLLNSY
jgi:hypothetical protein